MHVTAFFDILTAQWLGFIVVLAFVFWLLLRTILRQKNQKYEALKNLAEVWAIVAAGVFFGFRTFDGWNGVNMDATVKADRATDREDPTKDIIGVEVDLQKGGVGTIQLYDAEIRAVPLSDDRAPRGDVRQYDSVALFGQDRLQTSKPVDWKRTSSDKYRLTANEKLHLAGVLRGVPRGEGCLIELVVIGWRNIGYCQWKSSTVLLPATPSRQ